MHPRIRALASVVVFLLLAGGVWWWSVADGGVDVPSPQQAEANAQSDEADAARAGLASASAAHLVEQRELVLLKGLPAGVRLQRLRCGAGSTEVGMLLGRSQL